MRFKSKTTGKASELLLSQIEYKHPNTKKNIENTDQLIDLAKREEVVVKKAILGLLGTESISKNFGNNFIYVRIRREIFSVLHKNLLSQISKSRFVFKTEKHRTSSSKQ